MSKIHNVSENTLIIQQEHETWFINKTEEGVKLKCEFITSDGYEVGIEGLFSENEVNNIVSFLKEVE